MPAWPAALRASQRVPATASSAHARSRRLLHALFVDEHRPADVRTLVVAQPSITTRSSLSRLSSGGGRRSYARHDGIASAAFGAFGNAGINVTAIPQGSSERNISMVIGDGDAVTVRALHQAFKLHEAPAEAGR